jgi:hypothetical protein
MKNDETASLQLVMKQFVILSSFLILVSSFIASCSPASTVDDSAVRSFLTRYFSTWSAKDMDGYGSCFHEQARITFVQQGLPQSQGLTDFLHCQKLSHANASSPMTEVPTDMKILSDDRTAQASVQLVLASRLEASFQYEERVRC